MKSDFIFILWPCLCIMRSLLCSVCVYVCAIFFTHSNMMVGIRWVFLLRYQVISKVCSIFFFLMKTFHLNINRLQNLYALRKWKSSVNIPTPAVCVWVGGGKERETPLPFWRVFAIPRQADL